MIEPCGPPDDGACKDRQHDSHWHDRHPNEPNWFAPPNTRQYRQAVGVCRTECEQVDQCKMWFAYLYHYKGRPEGVWAGMNERQMQDYLQRLRKRFR